MNVSLGHDCFFTLDTAEYIRYAYLIHKAHNANPTVIPPFQIMDMALGNGAQALGWDDTIGSLEEEKAADIIIINPDSPSPVTPASVFSYFTMTFNGEEVETVIVDGDIVVENHQLVTGDEEEIAEACLREAKELWKRNSIEV